MYTGLTNTSPSEAYLPESNYYSGYNQNPTAVPEIKKSYSINNMSYFQQSQLAGANSSLKLNDSVPAKSNSFLNSPVSYYTGSVTALNQAKIESGRATPSINNLNYFQQHQLPRTVSSFRLNASAPAKTSSYLNSPVSYQTGSVASLNPNKDESDRATPSINNFSYTQQSQLPRTASSLKHNDSNSFLNSPVSYYTGSVASLNQNKIESGRATPSINNFGYSQSKLSSTASSFKLNDSAPAPAKSSSFLNSPFSYYTGSNASAYNSYGYEAKSEQQKPSKQTTAGPLDKTYSSYQLNLESTPEYAYELEQPQKQEQEQEAQPASKPISYLNSPFSYYIGSSQNKDESGRATPQNQSDKSEQQKPSKLSKADSIANVYSIYPEYTYELEQPQKQEAQPSLYNKQQNSSFYKQVKNFASSRAPTPIRSTYLPYDYSESKPDKRSALDKVFLSFNSIEFCFYSFFNSESSRRKKF